MSETPAGEHSGDYGLTTRRYLTQKDAQRIRSMWPRHRLWLRVRYGVRIGDGGPRDGAVIASTETAEGSSDG